MNSVSATIRLLENSRFYYVLTTGMDGNYSHVNKAYSRAFKHIDPYMIGKPYHITMHPDDVKVCVQTSAKCFQNPNKTFPATIRKHDGKGGYIITQWEFRAMFDENSHPAGIFCLGHDITEFSMTKQQLEEAISAIDEKKDIIEQISWDHSHVVRKPVANILGLVNILEKMDPDQNLSNIYDMLRRSTEELDEVIKTAVARSYDESKGDS